MTLCRAIETWALGVINDLPEVDGLRRIAINAPETAPLSNDTVEQGINYMPQLVAHATEDGPEYAVKRLPGETGPLYGSRVSLMLTLSADGTASDYTMEAGDAAMAAVIRTLHSDNPPYADISAFAYLLILDEYTTGQEVDGDNRHWVHQMQFVARLRQ